MADIIPVKAIRSGADVVALGEMVSGDTIAASWLAGVNTSNVITATTIIPADTSIMVVDTLEITATGSLDNSGNVGVW